MNKIFSRTGLLALMLSLLAGCATLVPTDQASLSLVSVRPVNTTLLETSIDVVLRVTNEGNVPLRIEGSSHHLDVNGRRIGQGVSNAVVQVPPLGTATFPVTLRLENLKLLNEFGGKAVPPEVSYRIESRLFTASDTRGLPVVTEGVIDLRPYLNGLQLPSR